MGELTCPGTDNEVVSVMGARSAHTVMPHPTRPYLYVLPGGTANGTDRRDGELELAPTAIIDASDPANPEYVQRRYEHSVQGCHDLGWTPDGETAYCAGEAADLYGSLWIYDVSVPDLPVLAGRISPPTNFNGTVGYTGTAIAGGEGDGPEVGWVKTWCAAHNYNFVPGTHILVASWFAGGTTGHDVSNPLQPELSNPLQPELIAQFQPSDGVAWTAHYYGGYVITGDMGRGTDILEIPELVEAEDEAATAAGDALGAAGAALGEVPRVDMTDVLLLPILPERPLLPDRDESSRICVIPGPPATS